MPLTTGEIKYMGDGLMLWKGVRGEWVYYEMDQGRGIGTGKICGTVLYRSDCVWRGVGGILYNQLI